MAREQSIAHIIDRDVYWRDAYPPDIPAGRLTGDLRRCDHCGSMHPADLAAAIRAGATASWADRKYGWPHKAYVDGVPYPWAGMLESREGSTHPPPEEVAAGKWIRVQTGRFSEATGKPTFSWWRAGTPAKATTYAKFYSIHLQDATPEDRATIERHLGIHFTFSPDGTVRWEPAV